MLSFWVALECRNKDCSHLKLSILQKVGAPAAQVALVGLGLLIGNPLTCALFKQQSEISGGSLEPELNLDPRIKAFYNKGLWNKQSKNYKRSGELLIIWLLFYFAGVSDHFRTILLLFSLTRLKAVLFSSSTVYAFCPPHGWEIGLASDVEELNETHLTFKS